MRKRWMSLILIMGVLMVSGCLVENPISLSVSEITQDPAKYYGERIEVITYLEYIGAVGYLDGDEIDYDPTYKIEEDDEYLLVRDNKRAHGPHIEIEDRKLVFTIIGDILFQLVNGTEQYYLNIYTARLYEK